MKPFNPYDDGQDDDVARVARTADLTTHQSSISNLDHINPSRNSSTTDSTFANPSSTQPTTTKTNGNDNDNIVENDDADYLTSLPAIDGSTSSIDEYDPENASMTNQQQTNTSSNRQYNSETFGRDSNDGQHRGSKRLRDLSPTDTTPRNTTNDTPFAPLFGDTVLNELTETVANFLADNMKNTMSRLSANAELEIEAKLGIIVDRQTGRRFKCPIYSATALVHQDFMTFSSNMNVKQHQFFNELLNSAVSRGTMKYKRRKETDRVYHSRGAGRLRVTTNDRGEFLCSIRKTRIADLEILLPRSPLDIRLSINIEEPVDRPDTSGPAEIRRDKNRVTYERAPLRVDLTQVHQYRGGGGSEPSLDSQTHELEVEFINGRQLWHEFENLQQGKPNTYHQQIQFFLDTLRFLSRKSPYVVDKVPPP